MTMRTMKPGGLIAALILGIGLSPAAFAAGTDAGAQVDNQASVDYDVNGQGQATETSNTETFYVDYLVTFTMQTDDSDPGTAIPLNGLANTSGAPDNGYVLNFTLVNNSNDTAGGSGTWFEFTVGNSSLTAFDGAQADDDDMQGSFAVYNDVNNDNLLDGGDTDITSSAVQVAEGGTLNLLVIAQAPATGTDGDHAVVELVASVSDSAGGAVTDGQQVNGTAGYGTPDTSVQFVHGEDLTVAPGAEDSTGTDDGAIGDTSAFQIGSATLTVEKTNVILDDTVGGTAYYVPGAQVQYIIAIGNSGTVDAEDINLSDTLPGDVTYLEDQFNAGAADFQVETFTGGSTVTTGRCTDGGGGSFQYGSENGSGGDTTPADGFGHDGTDITTNDTAAIDVAAGECVEISFAVTID